MRILHIVATALLLICGALLVRGADRGLLPNEAGQIMVLMYHGIGPKESTWTRSISNFKKDLESLYARGYRPVPLRDVVNNRIELDAGYSPIVLTFDDGKIDNFRIIKGQGPKIDPDCAVGILEQFQEEHPDFKAAAVFFLTGEVPFGQPEWVDFKLKYLVSNGMDVGNHTSAHDNLSLEKYSNPRAIEKAIGKQAGFLQRKINEFNQNYRVDTYALCHGARPQNKTFLKYLKSGVYEDFQYENIAILNVGSGPSPSPATVDFNPMSIPRIRAGEIGVTGLGIENWINRFDGEPERRYISDGDPNTVSIPSHLVNRINESSLKGARLRVITF